MEKVSAMSRTGKYGDEVFMVSADRMEPLVARSMKQGLFGKKLEDALQTLIERYPEVIPGKQIDPGSENPPRFVLLRREMPVGGWSLDHLLVDQEGVLTLVEAKLLQNPEARREVIGQAMEYAANALESWSNGRIRTLAENFWSERGRKLEEVIRERLGAETDVDALWGAVEENLQKGRMRLLIAADELRPEVRRIIEYLNVEMANLEVYGLELRCYGDESTRMVLVPLLVGRTQATADRKTSAATVVLWTPEALQEAYGNLSDGALGDRLNALLRWAVDRGFFLAARAQNPMFGLRGRSGQRIFSFFPTASQNIYWFANERHYREGAPERDRLLRDLDSLGMLQPGFRAEEIVSGRTLARNLVQLSDQEFQQFMETVSQYCANASAPG